MRFRYSCLKLASLTSLSICLITWPHLGLGKNSAIDIIFWDLLQYGLLNVDVEC